MDDLSGGCAAAASQCKESVVARKRELEDEEIRSSEWSQWNVQEEVVSLWTRVIAGVEVHIENLTGLEIPGNLGPEKRSRKVVSGVIRVSFSSSPFSVSPQKWKLSAEWTHREYFMRRAFVPRKRKVQ